MITQNFASFPDITNESINKFVGQHRAKLSQLGDGIPRTREGFVDLSAVSSMFGNAGGNPATDDDDDMSNITHFYLVSVSIVGLYVLYRFIFPKR